MLTSLSDGPKHGYALIRDIEGFAEVSLGPGTLYGCLAKLEKGGLIEPLAGEEARRSYRITASGSAALQRIQVESRPAARIGASRLAGAPA